MSDKKRKVVESQSEETASSFYKCVDNVCYFAKENLPTFLGYSQSAVQQLSSNPMNVFKLPSLVSEKKMLFRDFGIVKSLLMYARSFLARSKRFKYPICYNQEIEASVADIEERFEMYYTAGKSDIDNAKNEYFFASQARWYREKLQEDIALLSSIIQNLEIQISEYMMLAEERRSTQDPKLKEQIDDYLLNVFTQCKH
jgi:hypothetical protein